MNYTVILLEQVSPKYCKPGETIIHEYFLQGLRMDGRLSAYRRSLYTHEYLCKGSEDFDCDVFSSLEEASEWKKELEVAFPEKTFKILKLTDDEFLHRSTAFLERVEA